MTAIAVYAGADKDNYENLTMEVILTRAEKETTSKEEESSSKEEDL